jgi:PAS domain S-box-containing protein
LTQSRPSAATEIPGAQLSAACIDVLFQHTLGPLALLDRDFNFIRVNQAYAAAAGRRVEDFGGRNHFELFPSDARTIFEEVVRSKQPFSVKARPFEFPDHPEWGMTYWDWNLAPTLDASGEVEALVFSLEDVTPKVTGATRAQERWSWGKTFDRLPLDRAVSKKSRAVAIPVGMALEVLLLYGLSFLESPRQILGIPGPAATLIGILVGLAAGPVAGAAVALVGGVAYVLFLADFGSALAWPTIVISVLLWTAAAVLAALVADRVRARAATREALLSQAVDDRDKLVESLKASEEQQRKLAEENRLLYQQQLDIAEKLQTSLLHVPAEIGQVRIGHLYRSATEAARVGGDFYDVFQAKGANIVVLIGDVSGHGIEAARTATLVKDTIHAFAYQSPAPDKVLARTNALLVEKALPGFVTVFFGLLDPKSGVFQYASAGHPHAYLRRTSGSLELLGQGSLPVGVYADASWRSSKASLEMGDILLLYTDGVIEAQADGERFGDTRLEPLVKRKNVSVERLPRLILDKVLAFSHGRLLDDAALLALQLTDRN